MADAGVPEGLGDGPALEAWLVAHVDGIKPPLSYERLTGGRSNLTFAVRDGAGSQIVLRRPPLHTRLPSAHDMGREHRIQAALAGTSVPVPTMLGHCADESVIGAEFYVMGHVDGITAQDRHSAAALPLPARRTASADLVDTLVALHRVEPDAVGLGDLARREGYIERQLTRWRRQWEAQRTRDLGAMETVHAALAARVPEQGPARLVHGDYRLDNVRLSPAGTVRAVLDWELATLGDPLADVGMLAVYWCQPDDRVMAIPESATLEPGFSSRDELIERYRQATGTEADLDFYVAFAYWRLAAILEGVTARTLAGAYGETDSAAGLNELVTDLAEEAQRLVT